MTSHQQSSESKSATEVKTVDDQKTFDINYVSQLREENKTRRIETKELKELTDKLKQQVTSLEDQYKENSINLVKQSLKTEALKANILDVDVVKLLESKDTESIKIVDGVAVGAGEVINQLKISRPHLFSTKAKSTSGNYSFSAPANNEKLKSALDMTAEEYAAYKREAGLTSRH